MSSPGRIINRISIYLPRLGLSALILCLASGMVLMFYYRPIGNVFQNVEEITSLVPYGWFFRQLHYGAGQVFVILMLLHTVDHFVRKRYSMYALREWLALVVSLALCFYTLFTGFILKGDQEGRFAGAIFMNILETLPIAGRAVAALFIVPGESFFFLPYLYHCFLLPLLVLYLMRGHIREWLPNRRFMLSGGIGLFLYALLVKPGMDIPPEASMAMVEGPWFFLGIQTLLKFLPPLVAGLVIPGLFIGGVLLLPATGNVLRALSFKKGAVQMGEKSLYGLLMILACLYGLLTLRAAIWGP
ncbi:MAG: cytochrome b N-terminal domain-containing protein [Deltaproteobacteria bacterium]|nr:cytochrome b N-terminal domain-containing protein [Deltaproteobacteria bacterium]